MKRPGQKQGNNFLYLKAVPLISRGWFGCQGVTTTFKNKRATWLIR